MMPYAQSKLAGFILTDLSLYYKYILCRSEMILF